MPAARISTLERSGTLDRLERERFDCVVVGGGITGAGVAHEASSRGLSVALLEAADFASGTSSRSSKLIHGGLRYLAMGDVRLVRETARERITIREMAPHLAEPRWMVVPVRSRAGLAKMRAAIAVYETLGGVERGDLHQNWSGDDLEREEPTVRRSTYPFACAYREYLTDDSRLVLAVLRGAVASGAAVLNHAAVGRILIEGDRAVGAEATCRFTGRTVRVRGRCVINAAGPWVESVRALEDASAPSFLHLSKGIHVVLPSDRVPLRNLVVLLARGRSIFTIRRGAVVYVGTTDTTYPGGPSLWPEITMEDVEYLLEPLHRYLDVEPIKPEEVVAAWAGLRPLVGQPGKKPSEISRRDEILVGSGGVVTIAGGKLTGFRATARRTVEQVAEISGLTLGTSRVAPVPGGDFDGDVDLIARQLVAERGVPESAAARLSRLYGAEAADVVEGGFRPLVPGASVDEAEVEWAVTQEGAATVLDVLYRRLGVAYYEPGLRESAVEPVADLLSELLGWDARRRDEEIASTRARLTEDLAFSTGAV